MVAMMATNMKVVGMVNQVIRKVVGIFMVISVPVHFSMVVLFAVRQDWFMVGIHLVACAITVVICAGVLMALKIDNYSRRLEELISGYNEGQRS